MDGRMRHLHLESLESRTLLAANSIAVVEDSVTVPRAPAEDSCTFAYPGDANCDRVFDSSDLVMIMQAAEYEDGVQDNSDWQDGDFDGDGDFTSSDLVMAFKSGELRETGRRRADLLRFPHRWSASTLRWFSRFRSRSNTHRRRRSELCRVGRIARDSCALSLNGQSRSVEHLGFGLSVNSLLERQQRLHVNDLRCNPSSHAQQMVTVCRWKSFGILLQGIPVAFQLVRSVSKLT